MKNKILKFLSDYPQQVQQRVERHFVRFCDLSNDLHWLQTFIERHGAQFAQVWAASEFVCRRSLVDPAMLRNLVASGDFFRQYPKGYYDEHLHHLIQGVENEAELIQILRSFRNREMVRLAWRDITGQAGLNEVMKDLSSLADACIHHALSTLHRWQMDLYGAPQDSTGQKGQLSRHPESQHSQRLIVIAMGKLGAHELNFSSDIDLIFVYPRNGDTVGGPRSISNEEFFSRLGRKLIGVLDNDTADGFVFRVDMRLRPFGNSGPLVVTLDAMENYYQTHGREWERYAMIKARVVCGDPDSSDELMETLRPFVYRRYLDYGAYDSLRDMKQRIIQDVKRKGIDENIKLGAGGIREIEFIGQAFQLIRGGRHHELQQKQILNVLTVLGEDDILPAFVVEELKQAYVFLRTTEHRLQQYDDKQTHNLPASEPDRQLLALSMGFKSWTEFKAVLDEHRQHVRNHFDQVFAAPQLEQEQGEDDSSNPRLVWLQQCEKPQCLAILESLGYRDAESALSSINSVRSTARFRTLTSQSRERLNQLMPLIIAAVGARPKAGDVLKNILQIVEEVYKRVSYLALLAENPMALSQLVTLCAASPWIASQLKNHPMLLDELLDPRNLYHPPSREELEDDMARRTGYLQPDDLEQNMDALRHFKQTNMLRVAAADVSGAVPLMIVSDHLTYIAEIVLGAALNVAWLYLVKRHGYPGGNMDDSRRGFAIIAYGKLGGIELSYGSDLDLVFLYNADPNGVTGGDKPISNSVFYSRLGQRLIHILTTYTPAGDLYDIDMRLRPSGESGFLVTHIDSFSEYQASKAWTWEHQALVRARAISGDPDVITRFNEIRSQILSRQRDRNQLCGEVVSMRERMRAELAGGGADEFDIKQDKGGIADIEFMVQYMVLGWAGEFANMLTYSDNIRILDAIKINGLMSDDDTQLLVHAYKTLRARTHKLALQDRKAIVKDQAVIDLAGRIGDIWRKYMDCENQPG